jgi:hypothetical protein
MTVETVAAATEASDQLTGAPRPVFRPGDRVLALILVGVTFCLALQSGALPPMSFTRPDQDSTSNGNTGGAGGDGSE